MIPSVDESIAEVSHDKTWCDVLVLFNIFQQVTFVKPLVPSPLSLKDIRTLLRSCPSLKDSPDAPVVLEEHWIVSKDVLAKILAGYEQLLFNKATKGQLQSSAKVSPRF